MNERIREILTQCQQESIDGPEYPHWTDFEKFAELIIKECSAFVYNYPEKYLTRNQAREISMSMEEHFGVEE